MFKGTERYNLKYFFNSIRDLVSGYKPASGVRLESRSVHAHRCHRRAAEICLREQYKDFTFLLHGEVLNIKH